MHPFDTTAKGVYLITVTPFTDTGALDLASTDRMVDFSIERGVTGLTILGIMGEATKLTAEEARIFTERVVQRVAEVNKLDLKIENGKVVAFRAKVSLSFKYEA